MKPKNGFGVIGIVVILLLCASCASNAFLEYDPQIQEEMDAKIHALLLSQLDGLNAGELNTEGHIILTSKEQRWETRVYIIAAYTAYGFEDGFFHEVSGQYPAFVYPAVVVFPQEGQYDEAQLLLCETNPELLDEDWIRANFPAAFVNRAIHAYDEFDALCKQQDEQALAYLNNLGYDEAVLRKGPVKRFVWDTVAGHFPYPAYNALMENIELFDKYPYWIGTLERVEEGTRYVYETQVADGCHKINYIRRLPDGTVVEAYEVTEVANDDVSSVLIISKRFADGSVEEQCRYRITGNGAEPIT